MTGLVACVALVVFLVMCLATAFYDPICDRLRGRRCETCGLGVWDRDDEEVG